MMASTSKSVISAADHTAMTTSSVPCRIRMLPKIHRVPKTKKMTATAAWKNPKKTKTPPAVTTTTTTTKAETPVKKAAAPPTIRRISTPTTVASSPSASVEKSSSSSPAPSVVNNNNNKEEESSNVAPSAAEEEVKPTITRKPCAITSIPKVHKRVRAPPPAVEPEEGLDLPMLEISFVHSEEGDNYNESSEIARELMFGEDEGFEGILNGSINRDELDDFQHHQDDQFLRRNRLVNTSPQPNTNSSMVTELRRNRDKLDTSFPNGGGHNHSITMVNELSFETTSSMAVGERLHLSPIRPSPRRQVVGEETIMDTSREVEMVRNSFFDNEELVEELELEQENNKKKTTVEIPKEISLVTVSAAVVDDRDFVSPMQRLRSQQSLESLKQEQDAVDKQKRKEATRKSNIVKHLAAERKKQEEAAAATASAEAKKKEEEAKKKKARNVPKVRQEPQANKKQALQPKRKLGEKKKKQPKKSSTEKPAPTVASPRPSSPPTTPNNTTGSFVPEWANKSLRKTTTIGTTTTGSISSASPTSSAESVKSTVSTTSSNKVPAWANKQLRKSTTTAASITSCSNSISSCSTNNNNVSDELSSWMGKRRRASEGIQEFNNNKK